MKRITPLSASLIINRKGWQASNTICFKTILVIMMAAAIEEHNVLSPLRHTHTCSKIRYDTRFLSSRYVKMLQNDIWFNMLHFGM
jgi:hypothetical protein